MPWCVTVWGVPTHLSWDARCAEADRIVAALQAAGEDALAAPAAVRPGWWHVWVGVEDCAPDGAADTVRGVLWDPDPGPGELAITDPTHLWAARWPLWTPDLGRLRRWRMRQPGVPPAWLWPVPATPARVRALCAAVRTWWGSDPLDKPPDPAVRWP